MCACHIVLNARRKGPLWVAEQDGKNMTICKAKAGGKDALILKENGEHRFQAIFSDWNVDVDKAKEMCLNLVKKIANEYIQGKHTKEELKELKTKRIKALLEKEAFRCNCATCLGLRMRIWIRVHACVERRRRGSKQQATGRSRQQARGTRRSRERAMQY